MKNKIIILILWVLSLLTFYNHSLWLSFSDIIKKNVVQFFSEGKFIKAYYDSYKYVWTVIADKFVSNSLITEKDLINNYTENIVVTDKTQDKIKLWKQAFLKDNEIKIKNTITYLLWILNNNYNTNKNITDVLYNNKGEIWTTKWPNKVLLDNYFKIIKNKMTQKYNLILLKDKNVLYQNLYKLAILITETWNYIEYNNKDNKQKNQNITLYLANSNSYIFNPNSQGIKNIIRIFSKQNWQTIIWRLLTILNTLNN